MRTSVGEGLSAMWSPRACYADPQPRPRYSDRASPAGSRAWECLHQCPNDGVGLAGATPLLSCHPGGQSPMTHLTEQFHLPEQYHAICDRLTTLVARHTRRLLADEYWADIHLAAIAGRPPRDAFHDVDEYVYSRFKRCVSHRVTQVLDAHTDEYHAFQFVTDTVAERKIRRIGWRRLRTRLFEDDSPYIPWGVLEAVVGKLNTYYDRHGRFPETYTELVDRPQPNGTLPYAPDKGDYHIHGLAVEDGEVVVALNAPDTLTPASYHDWTTHELRFPTHSRFHKLLDGGELKAPTLHASEGDYTLDVPISVPEHACETVTDRVMAVDLGVKKQATAVVLEAGEGATHEQLTPPQFIDHPTKEKLFRLKSDADGINDRIARLRQQGKAHTERFAQLLAEYRQTRRKERRLREQIQHDVANELVWLAADHGCEMIVFESLGQLDAGTTSGVTAWSITSWARGALLDRVEYKAQLLGIGVETVNPWGTSRYCPRCGERGQTVTAPDDHTECRHGGHFHCPACGYECDRDAVGAVNVGRKYLNGCLMEEANPTAYTEVGNHASFPSHTRSDSVSPDDACARSAGVQSATETGSVSGRQSRRSNQRAMACGERSRNDTGGLTEITVRNTGWRCPSGSITRYILTCTTDSNAMLLNPTEN